MYTYSYYAKISYMMRNFKNQLKNLFVLRLCPMMSGNSKDLKKELFSDDKNKYKSPIPVSIVFHSRFNMESCKKYSIIKLIENYKRIRQ